MRKTTYIFKILIITVFLISSSITVHTIRTDDPSKVIKVGLTSNIIIVPDDYPTIQAAIDHATIMNTEILVRRGEYKENIRVNKMLVLTGSGTTGTIITGDKTDDVVTIVSDGVKITGFTIQNSGNENAGIRVDSHFNTITRCLITNNGYGIILDSSSGNFIEDNVIKDNAKSGFWFYRSNANEVHGNELEENNNGMLVNFSCLGNQVKGNIFSENENQGLQLSETSRSNTFVANNINNNEKLGVQIIGSSDSNILHHNDMIDNNQNAIDTSTNNWNDSVSGSGEGNYWSDYTGVDQDGDGIGDTPYLIPKDNTTVAGLKGNQDNFPLMNSNIPMELKIEVLNIDELKPNEEIEFEITYRHSLKQSHHPFEEEVFCQIDWDDDSTFREELMNDNGIYVTHTWNLEGTYNIRVRSFQFVVEEPYHSPWYTLSLPLEKKTKAKSQNPGWFFCTNLEIVPVSDGKKQGFQTMVSGCGIFHPEIMLTTKANAIQGENEGFYTVEPIGSGYRFPIFFWYNAIIDEHWFTDSMKMELESILVVNDDPVKTTFASIISTVDKA